IEANFGFGGSVCESNAPATSEMPPAGFEDRDDHRTACASVFSACFQIFKIRGVGKACQTRRRSEVLSSLMFTAPLAAASSQDKISPANNSIRFRRSRIECSDSQCTKLP